MGRKCQVLREKRQWNCSEARWTSQTTPSRPFGCTCIYLPFAWRLNFTVHSFCCHIYGVVQQSTVQLCSTKYRTVMWPRRQSAHEVRNFNLNIKWSLLLAPRSGRLTPGKNQSVTHNRSRNIRKECFQLPSILKAAASCQNCTIGNRLEFGAVRREDVVI